MNAKRLKYDKTKTIAPKYTKIKRDRQAYVQNNYNIDELFDLVQSKYADTEKLGELTIGIKDSTAVKMLLNLSEDGSVLELNSYWGNDEKHTLEKLNQINAKYNFAKLYLDENNDLVVKMDIDLRGVSKNYILAQIDSFFEYNMLVIPTLEE